ncbi:MAG: hypothetical protein A3K90_08530 [Pelodictyon luteolum]|uniref:Uncharacterized protein n=2 Tax=Pelodictyon luteolum TaxID=1100 RepID=A0A165L6V4_PELLU|nr:hypothetical protein [Pelodictyon luteolum]KZK73648.1 MAG: hypothetical protein A3K90_08530 [Pelodictyon luteolum]
MLKFFLFLVVLWLIGRLLMRVLRSAFVSFLQGAAEGRVPLGPKSRTPGPKEAEEADFEVVESRLRDEERGGA